MLYTQIAITIVTAAGAYLVGKRGGLFGPSSADTADAVRNSLESAKEELHKHVERALTIQGTAHERLTAASDYHAQACESVKIATAAHAAISMVKI